MTRSKRERFFYSIYVLHLIRIFGDLCFFLYSLLFLAIFRLFLYCYGFGLRRIVYKLNIKEPIPYPALHSAQPFVLHTATEFTVLHCTLDNQPYDAECESGCIKLYGRGKWDRLWGRAREGGLFGDWEVMTATNKRIRRQSQMPIGGA